jgi:hypothetical protein
MDRTGHCPGVGANAADPTAYGVVRSHERGSLMPDFSARPDLSALAARLAETRDRMAALDLPGPLTVRLHRHFIAVCDAIKATGADETACERRLAAFVAALDRAAARFPGCRNSSENS